MVNTLSIKVNGQTVDFDPSMTINLNVPIYKVNDPFVRGLPSTFNFKLPRTSKNETIISLKEKNVASIYVATIPIAKGELFISSFNNNEYNVMVLASEENFIKEFQSKNLSDIKGFYDDGLAVPFTTLRYFEIGDKLNGEFGLTNNLFNTVFHHFGYVGNPKGYDYSKYTNVAFENQHLNSIEKPYLFTKPYSSSVFNYGGNFYRLPNKELRNVKDGALVSKSFVDNISNLAESDGTTERQIPLTNVALTPTKVGDFIIDDNVNSARLGLYISSSDQSASKFEYSAIADTPRAYNLFEENEVYNLYGPKYKQWDGVEFSNQLAGSFGVTSDRVKEADLIDVQFIEDIPFQFNVFRVLQQLFAQYRITLKVSSELYNDLSSLYFTYSKDKNVKLPYRSIGSYQFKLDRTAFSHFTNYQRIFERKFPLINTIDIVDYSLMGGSQGDINPADIYRNYKYAMNGLTYFYRDVSAKGFTYPNGKPFNRLKYVGWVFLLPLTPSNIVDSVYYNSLASAFESPSINTYLANELANNYLDYSILGPQYFSPAKRWEEANYVEVDPGTNIFDGEASHSPVTFNSYYRAPVDGNLTIGWNFKLQLLNQFLPATTELEAPVVLVVKVIKEFTTYDNWDGGVGELFFNGNLESSPGDSVRYFEILNSKIKSNQPITNTTSINVNKGDLVTISIVGYGPSLNSVLVDESDDYAPLTGPAIENIGGGYYANTSGWSFKFDSTYDNKAFIINESDGVLDIGKNLPDINQMKFVKDILVRRKLILDYEPESKIATLRKATNDSSTIELRNFVKISEEVKKPIRLIEIGYKSDDKNVYGSNSSNYKFENDLVDQSESSNLQYLFDFATTFNKPYKTYAISNSTLLNKVLSDLNSVRDNINGFRLITGYLPFGVSDSQFAYLGSKTADFGVTQDRLKYSYNINSHLVKGLLPSALGYGNILIPSVANERDRVNIGENVNPSFDYTSVFVRNRFEFGGINNLPFFYNGAYNNLITYNGNEYLFGNYSLTALASSPSLLNKLLLIPSRSMGLQSIYSNYRNQIRSGELDYGYFDPISNGIRYTKSIVGSIAEAGNWGTNVIPIFFDEIQPNTTEDVPFNQTFVKDYGYKLDKEQSLNSIIIEGQLDISDYRKMIKGNTKVYFDNKFFRVTEIVQYNPVTEQSKLELIPIEYGSGN